MWLISVSEKNSPLFRYSWRERCLRGGAHFFSTEGAAFPPPLLQEERTLEEESSVSRRVSLFSL